MRRSWFFAMVLCALLAPSWAEGISQQEEGAQSGAAGHHVLVYYFHGNQRCSTCRKIEALSRKAIEEGFRKELAEGELRLEVVNIDEPQNRHFVDDYQLYTRSLIVVEREGGRDLRHKNLARIWELVHDPVRFSAYVQEEVAGLLDAVRPKARP